MRVKKIILIILGLLLTGCYNHMELNKMAIVSLIAVDYQKDEFAVTIEVRENKKEDENASTIYKSSGSSLAEALQKIAVSLNKALYFIDLDVVIITKDAANEKLDFIVDYLTRESTISGNFNILINDEIDKTISCIKDKGEVAGKFLKETVVSEFNNVVNIKFNDYLENYISKYYDLILPKIENEDDEIKINSAVIFNDKKIIAEMDFDMVELYNLLINNHNPTLFNINYEEKTIIFKVISSKAAISYQDNKVKIELDITGSISEAEDIDVNDKNNIKKIRSTIEDRINDDVNFFINFLIDNNSDILGFRKDYYNTTRKNIESIGNLKTSIKTNVTLDRNGLIFGPIGEEHEKNN